ncbi:MAG: inositol monophosphatase [Anaerolineae bacterium]|nr:MAG: inositol monophosphatase [Anaerolineae bacterium]
MSDPLAIAIETARAAGDLLRSRFKLHGSARRLKPDHTTLTDADLEADQLITRAIRAAFPDEAILTEESETRMPADGRPTWVIDPIDGTTNFARGLHTWGVSIARLVDGLPSEGALYFPLLNELYSVRKGEGAQLNGEAIHTRPPDPDSNDVFFTCCTRTHRRYQVDVQYKLRILGSAAYDFCAIARGATIAGFQATPHLWDLAAGWLVLEEAGGAAAVLHGPAPFPAQAGEDYGLHSYPTLMAGSAALLDTARGWVTLQA